MKHACSPSSTCAHAYGRAISGTRDDLAAECRRDPRCMAFEYTGYLREGAFCKDSVTGGSSRNYEICKINPGFCWK